MHPHLLSRSIKILLFLFLLFSGLYYAKAFLIPICFGGILAMLFLPIIKWFEKKGIYRSVACLMAIVILGGMIWLMVWLLGSQVKEFSKDTAKIERNVKRTLKQFQQTISENVGIGEKQQEELISSATQPATSGSGEQSGSIFASIGAGLVGFVTDFVLVLVYIFLFAFFRDHLKRFALKLVPEEKQATTMQVAHDCSKVAQQYLGGLGSMIVVLWILYGIGFSIVGVENAFFFAILCGLLEIIPFIGNLTGTALTIIMAISQGGDSSMILGILITYAFVQIFQTYVLEPLIVGSYVNINPLFIVLILVLGEMLWGIPGMILAIPVLAIIKIICDHIEPLKPYGFLIGEERKQNSGFIDKIKNLFKKNKHKNEEDQHSDPDDRTTGM